jgi:hypothetical protein
MMWKSMVTCSLGAAPVFILSQLTIESAVATARATKKNFLTKILLRIIDE